MKKSHRIIAVAYIFTILTVLLCTHFNAATIYKSDGFLYAITSSSRAEIHGRETEDANVVIPKDFNDYYVTEIVDSAFSGDNNIVSLSFSKAVLLERIGYYAFANCRNLSGTVYLTGKIINIGVSAFQDCSSLEGIVFQNQNIEKIYAQTCYNCTSLSYVELPDRLKTIEKYAFANTAIKEITIPRSVTAIDKTAFDGCEGLVINCYTGSFAQQFAEENGIDYVLLDAPAPTEPPTEPETEPATEPVTEPATEPETVPVTEPATELLGYILGDVDNNDAVESIDATWIQRYSVQMELPIPEENMVQGDVDGDGETNVYDATFIQRYVVNIPTPYDSGKLIAL